MTEKKERKYGQFDDKLTVYTSSAGTQCVLPTDALFTENEKRQLEDYLKKLREKRREKEQ